MFREEDFADTPDQAFVPHPTPDMALPTGKTQAPYWIWQVRSLWHSPRLSFVYINVNSMLPWLNETFRLKHPEPVLKQCCFIDAALQQDAHFQVPPALSLYRSGYRGPDVYWAHAGN